MKIIVLYIASLMIIFLTEKEYRNRKLFLYPSFLLCPVIGVIAYAGTLLTFWRGSEQDQKASIQGKAATWKQIGVGILFVLVILLGGDRTIPIWFKQLLWSVQTLDLTVALTGIVVVLSILLYAAIVRNLRQKDRKETIFFVVLICLMYLCGYRWSGLMEEWMLGTESIDMLVLRQIMTPGILLLLLKKGTDRPLKEELLGEAVSEDQKVSLKVEGEHMSVTENQNVNHTEESQKSDHIKETKNTKTGVLSKLINVKTLTLALIILAVLTLFSIFTLNRKINNMSLYMQHIEESIDESK
jgi:hypothetical protein